MFILFDSIWFVARSRELGANFGICLLPKAPPLQQRLARRQDAAGRLLGLAF